MATKKETTLQVQEPQAIQGEAEILISQAISQNIPVESLERLLAMRKELRQEKAQEEFIKAMKNFQKDCPTIVKKSKVSFNTTNYNYADLTAIVEQVKELLSENGFSYTFDTEETDKTMYVLCKVQHIGGHMEISRFKMEIDPTAKMNVSQKYGSSSTYAKRYAFINAFGILTGEDDGEATLTASHQQHAQNTPQNAPKQQSTTDSVLGSCPLCKVGRLERKMSKNDRWYTKCSEGVWNPQTKRQEGCRYIVWDKVTVPRQETIDDEIPLPTEE